jgi:hypothetical protein
MSLNFYQTTRCHVSGDTTSQSHRINARLGFQSSRTTAACPLALLTTWSSQRSTELVMNSAWAAEAPSKRRVATARSSGGILCTVFTGPHPASYWRSWCDVILTSKRSWCGSERSESRASHPGRGDGLTVSRELSG